MGFAAGRADLPEPEADKLAKVAAKLAGREGSKLAGERARAIAAALTAAGGLDPARVRTTDVSPVKRKKQGSDLVPSEMTMTAED